MKLRNVTNSTQYLEFKSTGRNEIVFPLGTVNEITETELAEPHIQRKLNSRPPVLLLSI